MARALRCRWVLASVIALCGLLLLALYQVGSQAASVDPPESESSVLDADQAGRSPQENPLLAAPAAPSACPANPPGLNQSIERSRFCVFYSLHHVTTNPNGVTAAQATTAADHVDDYWDRYATDFGFQPPLVTGPKMGVRLVSTTTCNGSAWDNHIELLTGCYGNDEVVQKNLGHELFHRVQFGYDTDWNTNWQHIGWLYEGTARASEDNAFNNIDNWPNCLTSRSSFNSQVNTYLAAPNNDITSYGMRYNSCLWWKYFTEQYGTTTGEPQLGIDAFLRLWQNANEANGISSVNKALGDLEADTNFNAAFRRFIVANWTKDLTGLPDTSYNYVDEDQAGNCAPYGPLQPHDGGTINIGTSATWSGSDGLGVPFSSVRRYGARYYSAQPGTNCPVASVRFRRTSGTDTFYHVITQKGNSFDTHVQGSGKDWSQSFMNDGITQIVAIAGAQAHAAQVNVKLACVEPELDIKLPNSVSRVRVQSDNKFLAQLLVTDGSATGPVVAGLTNSDFSARVGGVDATIDGGGFIQEQYWLVIRAPEGLADGLHDLEIMLEEPGTSTVIATDTEPDAVEYTTDRVDHVLVIDRSGSMVEPLGSTNTKLDAAKDAANFYVDITRDSDGLAVVAYHHDVAPAPFAMVSVTATERTRAKDYIMQGEPDGIYPYGATSIGDGLFEARGQRVGSTTGNPHCSFVLLSDGMENAERKWDTGSDPVKQEVQATGCPVTTIAFGPASNETLMQTIASDTGGLAFYNDVYVSSALEEANATSLLFMNLELGDTYEYAQANSEGRQRLLAEFGAVTYAQTTTHKVMIDGSLTDVVFALDWYSNAYNDDLELTLVRPDGTTYDHDALPYTFSDYDSNHVGWRFPIPPTATLETGEWKLLVHKPFSSEAWDDWVAYKVLVSGRSNLMLHLLLPDRLGTHFFTGNRIPIYAILSGDGYLPGAALAAEVTAPDGFPTMLPLFDDGQHGDGPAGDGVYANLYTRANQATSVEPPDEGQPNPDPDDEGAYRVRLVATGDDYQREAKGSFAILEGPDNEGNGLPDPWEEENDVSDPNGDPDLDDLINSDEYLNGTDPNNSDTDGGGENDGSEVAWMQNPLDPGDDEIEAPDSFQAAPQNGSVQLTYDVKNEYARMELWRAPSAAGPWTLHVNGLPLDGFYNDAAANGTEQHYRLIAEDGDLSAAQAKGITAPGHRSAVLSSEPVTPSVDPLPPEARVVINGGAASTSFRHVTLTFLPYDGIGDTITETFDDIAEMLISNDLSFAGATWQDFAQGVPWQLEGVRGTMNTVYVRFRDEQGNESTGVEVAAIFYDGRVSYLPLVMKNQESQ